MSGVMVSDELKALHELARVMGVHTQFLDGLKQPVAVNPETLVRVCAALGAPVHSPADATDALRARLGRKADTLPPVIVAWNGQMPGVPEGSELTLEDGSPSAVSRQQPFGYHRLRAGDTTATVISAPVEAWRPEGAERVWGVGVQLAALRSRRSRSVGDLRDLKDACLWLRSKGGNVVTILPLLPTFNEDPPEPSPYSPVSRLFWSELMLDLGDAHRPVPPPATLDVRVALEEVKAALAGREPPAWARQDAELARYARYRGAQARLGRNWRDFPGEARHGNLEPGLVDPDVERFHLVAQSMVRQQLGDLRAEMDGKGFRLGLDLAVGVHPDGYDPWSRQSLFANGMSVGAPPDFGFPSGQDWGFSPVLPTASRQEGHRYVAMSIGHQASLAGVLRIDHIMAWTRLYWIPHGMSLADGTYVNYPAEELFAVLTLESHRHKCEIIGENLGTVPKDIDEALPKHHIRGMYLAQFQAPDPVPELVPPTANDVALVGTHDTPTFADWIQGGDIGERVHYKLLKPEQVEPAMKERHTQVTWLAEKLGSDPGDPRGFLGEVLEWLGASLSPLVIAWLEDLWLEQRRVNLPGTPSSVRPNWQAPMTKLLDDITRDSDVEAFLERLDRARHAG